MGTIITVGEELRKSFLKVDSIFKQYTPEVHPGNDSGYGSERS